MSSEEAQANEDDQQQGQQPANQQASPASQGDSGSASKRSDEATAGGGSGASAPVTSGGGGGGSSRPHQQHQIEVRGGGGGRGGQFSGDRPLTMRERARLHEIEMLEEELAQVGESLPNARRLLELEIHRLRWGVTDMIDLLSNRKCKIRSKVLIPQEQYPGFNFVGKLLGQGGASLKKLQEETDVKMSILGAGSMRNDRKEHECLNTGEAKYQHLKQTLHLQIDCLADPTEAYYRISHALAKVKEAMTPDPNELAQYYANQMQQLNMGPGGPQPPPHHHYPVMGGGRGGRGGAPFNIPIGAMGGAGYGGGPMGGGMRGSGRGMGRGGRGGYPGGPGAMSNGGGMHYGDHHHSQGGVGGSGYSKPSWSGPPYRGGGGGGPRGAYHQQGGRGVGGGSGGGASGYAS